MITRCVILALALTLGSGPARAKALAASDELAETLERQRQEAGLELAGRVVDDALDPRRAPSALVAGAQAAGLVWKSDPDLGRRLFARVLARLEVMLATDTMRTDAGRAVPSVLASLAARDADAALEAVDRLAKATRADASTAHRATVLAQIAAALQTSHPDSARRFAAESLLSTGRIFEAWSAAGRFEGETAHALIAAGLATLERETATFEELADAASLAGMLRFSNEIELDRNARPEQVARMLALMARRLAWIRSELVEARAAGRRPSVSAIELQLAFDFAPRLIEAMRRWYPEGVELARLASSELATTGIAPTRFESGPRDAMDTSAKPAEQDADRIGRAYGHAHAGRDADARLALAEVANSEWRAAASDDVELVLAAMALRSGDWESLTKHLGRVRQPDLKVRALGAAASAVARRGVSDVAAALAADAGRVAARAPRTYVAISGLIEAAIAFETIGDATGADLALAAALSALDRVDTAESGSCACWPFVPSAFGDASVSSGLKVGAEDIGLGNALGLAADRDLIRAVGLVESMRDDGARDLARLALARRLMT